MSDRLVKLTIDNRIAVLTIDNPPMNVLNDKILEDICDHLDEIEKNNEINCVILTGAGERAFMAGADIKGFPDLMKKDAEGVAANTMNMHRMMSRLSNFNRPTIAVLNGFTLGGGCEMALLCDLRVAEEHAQIGLPEIKLGLFPGGGGTQRLPRLVGEAKAKELMFIGDPISAEEAKRIGLVNFVVPKGEGLAKAKELAARMNSYSLPALKKIKEAVNKGMQMTLDQGLEYEAKLFGEVFQTQDVKEGVAAFIEKRKPTFQNR